MISAGSALLCVAAELKQKYLDELIAEVQTDVGNSTIKMTFNATSNSRFFILDSLTKNEGFFESDFDYVIGGFNFTTAVKTAEKDVVVKVNSFKSDKSDTLAINRISDIKLLQSRANPLYFDTDIIIPQSVAKSLNIKLLDEINILMADGVKAMTVSGIAANSGFFASNNVLVDYSGLVSILKLPSFSTYNNVLFKLKDTTKSSYYINLIKSIEGYRDKTVALSIDEDAIFTANNSIIAYRSAIVAIVIVLIFAVLFFITQTRIAAHSRALKIMRELGAGEAAVSSVLLAEILMFSLAGYILGAIALLIAGWIGNFAIGLVSIPFCAAVYGLHLLRVPAKKRAFLAVAAAVLFIAAETLLAFFAFNVFFYSLIVIAIVLSIIASTFLNKLFCKLITPKARGHKMRIIADTAKNSTDKTSGIFLVASGVLIALTVMYTTYAPMIDNFYDTSNVNYAMTNIANGGKNIVDTVRGIDGVTRAIPGYADKDGVINGETNVYIIVIGREDYSVINKMFSVSGGEEKLKEGKAILSKDLAAAFSCKEGDKLSVNLGGTDYNVEIGAIETAALSKFIIIDSSCAADNLYNNILLKIDESKKTEVINILRAKYGHQNALVVELSEFASGLHKVSASILDLLTLIIFMVIFFAAATLLFSFIVKTLRESVRDKIYCEQGASDKQVFVFSLLSQIIASVIPLIISALLSVGILQLMIIYLQSLSANAVIKFSVSAIIWTALANLVGYISFYSIARICDDSMKEDFLTTSSGQNVYDDNNSLTTPLPNTLTMMSDIAAIDKLAHFNRERVPERVVHATGAGAYGVFEVTNSVSSLTSADFLSHVGKKTPVFVRFSTVGGSQGSSDLARDPRGFAVKFYTDDGNYDIVGNNTPIFFIRDAIKFPDFIHSQKRNPVTNTVDFNSFWDFFSLTPESIHMVTRLMSDLGTPDGFRHMDGFGTHTFMWYTNSTDYVWVKYHFKTRQGVKTFNAQEAEKLGAENPAYSTKDLYDSIDRGDYPSWDLYVQILTQKEADEYKYSLFDVTKIVFEEDYPLIPVGRLTLNRKPENFFNEVEQAAFCPGNLVYGIGLSPDKMLNARAIMYSDAQRHRIGPNFNQLPVNAPKNAHTYQRAGNMNTNPAAAPNYYPNSFKGVEPNKKAVPPSIDVCGKVARYNEAITPLDFEQARVLFESFDKTGKDNMIKNIAASLKNADKEIQKRQIALFYKVCQEYGERVERAVT
ncbi:catalase [Holotrichia oblita]|nr:catalase [Holotrichia oblita]